jgi:hypothetical protein
VEDGVAPAGASPPQAATRIDAAAATRARRGFIAHLTPGELRTRHLFRGKRFVEGVP